MIIQIRAILINKSNRKVIKQRFLLFSGKAINQLLFIDITLLKNKKYNLLLLIGFRREFITN